MKTRRAYQLLDTFAHADAIGNNVLDIDEILQRAGWETGIYCVSTAGVKQTKIALPYSELGKVVDKGPGLLIFHHSTNTELLGFLEKKEFVGLKKLLVYHNITPGEFVRPFDHKQADKWDAERKRLKKIVKLFDYVIADSEFNLMDLGLKPGMKATVVPLVANAVFRGEKTKKTSRKFTRNKNKILYVGRIAPNKKIENLIKTFVVYRDLFNKEAKLEIVGNFAPESRYFCYLCNLIDKVGNDGIRFCGRLSEDELIQKYMEAGVFLILSEHEGFGVIVLEACHFGTPVVFLRNTALRETMGKAGVGASKFNPLFLASILDRLKKDKQWRNCLVKEQKKRLAFFNPKKTERDFLSVVNKLL